MTDTPMPDRFDEMAREIFLFDEAARDLVATALRKQHIELKAESAKLRVELDELRNSYAELDIARENAKLREALEFYSDRLNYKSGWPDSLSPINYDEGKQARAALNEDKP